MRAKHRKRKRFGMVIEILCHRESSIQYHLEVKRICFVLQVKPDRLAEYKERHNNVWPEMRRALEGTGGRAFSLFLRDDGPLVGGRANTDFCGGVRRMGATCVD